MNKKHILVIVLLIFLAAGCQTLGFEHTPVYPPFTPQPISLKDFIGNEDCQPPCWNGIIPGETNEYDARRILVALQMGKVSQKQHLNKIYLITNKGMRYEFDYDREDVIELIYMYISPENVKLGQVINHYGRPAGYSYYHGEEGGPGQLVLYFPSNGMFLVVKFLKDKIISPDMKVSSAAFVRITNSALELREELESVLGPSSNYELDQVGPIMDWGGYGEMQ